MTNKLNAGLIKELSAAAKSKFTGAVIVQSKDSALTGRIFFYDGGVYAAQVDGYYPRVVARMAASGLIDLNREEHLRQHFGGNLLDPEIGAYAVQQEWLGVDALSAFHQEYLLATIGALASLPRIKVKRHKGETTNLFCTVPLPWEKVQETLDMRAMRLTNTWIPITPSADPNAVIPHIVNPAALNDISAAEIRTLAAAIDGAANVDAIAWRCGYTRAEAVHLLAMMVAAEAISLAEVAPQPFDPNNLFVPEAAGEVVLGVPMADETVEEVVAMPVEISAAAFGENDPDAQEGVHEVKQAKEKRGLFGRRKKKNDEDEVIDDVDYNVEEWVAPELSDQAVAGYEMGEDPYAVEEFVEDAVEAPFIEVWEDAPVEPIVEDLPVVDDIQVEDVQIEHVDGLLTQWATIADGEKQAVRLQVLMRMVEAAKADVEEKRQALEWAQGELDRAAGDLAGAEEHGRIQQGLREASEQELAALENVRNQAQADLDASIDALVAAQAAVEAKIAEIQAAEAEVERLRALLAQAEATVQWLNGEKVDLDGIVAQAESLKAERVEVLTEASLRAQEFAAGPHAQALEAERVAYENINANRVVVAAATDVRDEKDHALQVAQDVLNETVAEAEAAAARVEQ